MTKNIKTYKKSAPKIAKELLSAYLYRKNPYNKKNKFREDLKYFSEIMRYFLQEDGSSSKYYYVQQVGSGKRAYYKETEHMQYTCYNFSIELDKLNDAPRGGKLGNYIIFTKKGKKRFNAILKNFKALFTQESSDKIKLGSCENIKNIELEPKQLNNE